MDRISCFIATDDAATALHLRDNPLVDAVYYRADVRSSEAVRYMAATATGAYTMVYTKPTRLRWVHYALHRLLQIAGDTGAALIYSDHFKLVDGVETQSPVIDYQAGSLRDDFDFGSVMVFRTDALREAVAGMDADYRFAGLYDLRLRVSRLGPVVHVNEFLYYDIELDSRRFGEKLFDYVNPRNREVQIEMEAACTAHLKAIGGYLEPNFKEVDLSSETFEYEASVVIPCRNRARTIADAVRSALDQKTTFKYNVIVVDDNSTDGAAEIIQQLAAENPERLVYIAQDKTYHAIGGNWNAALHHPKCGKFALQLDSDDVYSGPDTVQKFVDAFYAQNCAMVIGSYQITDIALKPADMAPIEHREWTPDNGRNNALRINGLGAPRGFWTPLVREMTFPTTKYGEDYAVALRISREYRIGRIYDVMYFCRRWEGNSDATLDVETANRYNTYKDRIRTWELEARIAANSR
ncbi:MAG: glycosyltransferase [Bacteroidales bacterium]|nr:glycosyltransferase [Bacteroidales bacterium]